jgi:hypothetical protein
VLNRSVGGRRLGLHSLFALGNILVDLHELRFEDNPVGLETREHVDEVRLCICGHGFRPSAARHDDDDDLPGAERGGDNAWGGGAAAHAAQRPLRVPSGVAGCTPRACWAAARRRSPLDGEAMVRMGWHTRNSKGLRGGFLAAKLSTGRGKPR